MGECYHQEWAKAVEWYKKAAMQGLLEALHNLGDCYMGGFGVEKDRKQAFMWYQKAVDAGDETAQWLLDFFISGYVSGEQSDGWDKWKIRRNNLKEHKFAQAAPSGLKYELECAFGYGTDKNDNWAAMLCAFCVNVSLLAVKVRQKDGVCCVPKYTSDGIQIII